MIWVFQIEPESEKFENSDYYFVCFNPINNKLGFFIFFKFHKVYIFGCSSWDRLIPMLAHIELYLI